MNDLSVHTAEDLARFADSLNNRPRKTLGYLKPSERLAELLATSTAGPANGGDAGSEDLPVPGR